MAIRVTRELAEVAYEATHAARVTRQVVEAAYQVAAYCRVTRQMVEAAYQVAANARVSREMIEVAYDYNPAARQTRQMLEVAYIGVPSSAITPVPSRGTHNWVDHGGSHWSDAAVRWVFNGQELILNASDVRVEGSPRYAAPDLLSGDLVLSMDREYDETMGDGTLRTGRIRESARKIELTFPRMPTHFYYFMRSLRTFGQSFVIKIFLFDGLDKERLMTQEGRFWYASNGAWEPGSVIVYKNGEVVTDGISINHTHGIVRFMNAISTEDVVQVQYVWAPRVTIVGELNPEFRAGLDDPECKVKFTVREVRPSSTPDSWTRPTTGTGPGTGGGQPSTRTPTLGLISTVLGDTLRNLFLMALVRSAGTLPSDIADLWHWLDAVVGVTYSGNLHKISQWDDQSGRDKHATQAIDDLQPVREANAQNGLPMVRFNVSGNTGRALAVSNTVDNMVDTHDFTAFMVMKKLDPTYAPIYSWYSLAGTTPVGNVWGMGVNEIAFYNTLNGYALRTSHSIPTGQAFIATIQRSGNTWSLWINGVLLQTRTDARDLHQESSPAPHFGWWEFGGQFAWLFGMLGEWIVYNRAINATEFAQVMVYLRDKWHVALNFNVQQMFLGLLGYILGNTQTILGMYAQVSGPSLTTLGLLGLVSATNADGFANLEVWYDAASTTYGPQSDGAVQCVSASSRYLAMAADSVDLSAGDIDFFIGIWVYLDSKGISKTFFSKWDSTVGEEYILYYDFSLDRFYFVVRNTANSANASVGANNLGSPSTGTWYFILAWHDSVNNTINIRVNGGTANSTAHSAGVRDGTTAVGVGWGRISGTAYIHDGRLDSACMGKPPTGIAALISAINTSLYNSGVGKGYDDLTTQEKTDWGLKAFWDLDEAIGTRFDHHSNNHLQATTNTTWAPGIESAAARDINFAASFASGSSESLYLYDNPAISTGDVDFWIAGWALFATAGGSNQGLFFKWSGAGGAGTREYAVYRNGSNGRIGIAVSSDGNATFGSVEDSSFTTTIDYWYFIIAWHDSVNNTLNIRVNQGPVASTAYSAGVFNSTQALRLGAYSDNQLFHNGRLDSWGMGKPPGGIASIISTISTRLFNLGRGIQAGDITAQEKIDWGITGWWDLDEASGDRRDAFNYTRYSQLYNTSRYLRKTNAVGVPGGVSGSITMAGWAYLAATGAPTKYLFAVGGGGGANSKFYFAQDDSTSNMILVALRDGVTYTVVTGATWQANRWYFIVAWYDAAADTVNIQVDNGTVYTAAQTAGLVDAHAADAISLGSFHTTSPWNGKMSRWGMWDRPLTSGEKTELFNSTLGMRYAELSSGIKSGMVSYWDLEEADGSANRLDSHGTNHMVPSAAFVRDGGPGSNQLLDVNTVTQAQGVDYSSAIVGKELDGTGNSRHVAQATLTARPYFESNVQNSKPGILHDGSDDYMDGGNIAAINFERTNAFTFFIVLKPTSLASNAIPMAKEFNSGTYAGWYMAILSPTGNVEMFLQYSTNYVEVKAITTLLAVNTPYVIVCRSSGTGTAAGCDIWINGVKQTLTTIQDNLGSNSIMSAAPFTLGSRQNGGVPFRGYRYEAGVYSRGLTDGEIGNLSTGLMTKWGIP